MELDVATSPRTPGRCYFVGGADSFRRTKRAHRLSALARARVPRRRSRLVDV
jgi:hypothetical protein